MGGRGPDIGGMATGPVVKEVGGAVGTEEEEWVEAGMEGYVS